MRKLATAAISYSAAVFLAKYAIPVEWLLFSALASSAACTFFFIPRDGRRLRAVLICAGVSVGLLWSYGHYKLFMEPAIELAGNKALVSARVVSYPDVEDSYTSVELKLTQSSFPKVRMFLYSYDNRDEISCLKPGDTVMADIFFRSASQSDGWDNGVNTSRGIFILGSLQDTISTTGRSPMSFLYFPLSIARALKDELSRAYPDDVSHLITALLTGDKDLLRKDYALNAAMGRAGLLHVVAVSGMHVSFLVGFIRLLTGRRRHTAAICVPLIVVFIAMTGANPSVIRAGFLQILLILAPILRRENDNISSISAVLALLLLINPAAAKNVGLQLSFSAFAGIMLITPRAHDWLMALADETGVMERRFASGTVSFLINAFSSTIGAIAFSTPLVALHFGYVSIVSPITNILTLSIMSLCFTSGFIICGIGFLIPAAGSALAALAAWALRYVIFVVKSLSSIPFAAVFTSNNLVGWWLAFAYCVIGGTYLLRGERSFRPILPVCLSFWPLVFILLFTWNASSGTLGSVSALDVGQGQSIAVLSGSASVIIDCGGNAGDAGEKAHEFLLSRGRTRLGLLVLTHLHSDHVNGAESLITRMRVEKLALPLNSDDSDELEDDILAAAAANNTEIIYISEDILYFDAELALDLYTHSGGEDDNERGIIVRGRIGEFDFLVTGDAGAVTERRLLSRVSLPELELLIAGHHGSRYSSSEEFLEVTSPELAIVSSGKNSYGHPTTETLMRLDAAGAEIYRTDLCGNIEVIIK